MSVLDKLNETIEAMQDFQSIRSAHDLVGFLKNKTRSKVGNSYCKVDFDKTDYGNGAVFVRYARCPYNEANNEIVEKVSNFVVAIEGFDSEGGICPECGDFRATMILNQLPDGVKKMRRAVHPDIHYIGNYVSKYFEKYNESLCEQEGPAGVTASGNTPSTDVSGGTGTENAAVFKSRNTLKKKKKKPIKRGE